MKVIIPTRRSAAEMSHLVEQIKATAGVACEVFVTGVADGSASANRNRGLEWARGAEVVCMVDDDVAVPQSCNGWLRVLADALKRPDVVMVSSQLLKPEGGYAFMTGLNDCGGRPDRTGEWVVPTKQLLTACCAFKPNGLRFDEGYVGSGFEDTDFCNQLSTKVPAGLFLVCHASRAIHANEQKEQRPNWGINKAHYQSKWGAGKWAAPAPHKRVAALYKTYRGGEWFGASLESVLAGGCCGVVAVTSSEPWSGAPSGDRPENCREPLGQFRDAHPDFPVVRIDLQERTDSRTQYRTGLEAVKRAFGDDCGVLIVDTDEVWDAEALLTLRTEMAADRRALYFRAGIWTYLRSSLYRVHPQESARVVVGLAHPDVPLGDSRFSGLSRKGHQMHDAECSFHHFGYVRADGDEIVGKLANTASQDGIVSRPRWKEEVWDRLPLGRDLHPCSGYGHLWSSVVTVGVEALPKAVLDGAAVWPADVSDDPHWREVAEKVLPENCLRTVVADEHQSALVRLLGIDAEDAAFLAPRLRMNLREAALLAALVWRVPSGGQVLEVGSGHGGSMAVMGLARKDCDLWAVDPYLPYDEEDSTLVIGFQEGSADEFSTTLSRFAVRANLAQKPSEEVVTTWKSPLDLVLVDGNHSYSHAAHDIRQWWGWLRPGGLMLVHDFATRFPGVVRAVREFEERTGLRFNLPTRSTLAWVEKPR